VISPGQHDFDRRDVGATVLVRHQLGADADILDRSAADEAVADDLGRFRRPADGFASALMISVDPLQNWVTTARTYSIAPFRPMWMLSSVITVPGAQYWRCSLK
jgi:hypothetical protein